MTKMIDHLKALGYYEIRSDTPVPSDFVDRLQTEFGISLPEDYRAFLEEFPRNGGFTGLVVSPGIEKCSGVPDGLYEIFQVWGVGSEGESDIFSVNRDPDTRREGWFEIGNGSSSQRFYIGLESSSFGWVCFVDNYDPEAALVLVSRSFSDFMTGMYWINED